MIKLRSVINKLYCLLLFFLENNYSFNWIIELKITSELKAIAKRFIFLS